MLIPTEWMMMNSSSWLIHIFNALFERRSQNIKTSTKNALIYSSNKILREKKHINTIGAQLNEWHESNWSKNKTKQKDTHLTVWNSSFLVSMECFTIVSFTCFILRWIVNITHRQTHEIYECSLYGIWCSLTYAVRSMVRNAFNSTQILHHWNMTNGVKSNA